ncbi:MAG: TrkH family potassium uptake protein [Clostridiales bacterium]|nr:TrkH family potassium uptake protein [Clostridiales bacterium]
MSHVKKSFSTTRVIAFGFLGGILLGTLLLSLPIATKSGEVTPFTDALFTATTSICVTGLTTVTTVTHWSLFGQIVILLLIQFGGLGIVTFTTTIYLLLGKRVKLSDRLLIQNAYNLDTLSGLVKLTKKIIKCTLIVEGVGALVYMIQFIPEFNFFRGIWYSIFHSVSAFCNAGIDLIGDSSFVPYRENVLININTMILIILGGIGFPVWWDVIGVGKMIARKEEKRRRFFRKLSLHSKIAISFTLILIVLGTVLTLLLEYHNPNTIGNVSFGNKLMASTFQSVTTRTAGFATIPQQNFQTSSSVMYLVWMFIGGSPSGTAGGVKTVTMALILVSTICIVKGQKDIEIFRRKVSEQYLKKGLAVVVVSFSALLVMTCALAAVQESAFIDTLYETTSAIATVGLSRGFTGSLTTIGKLLIIVTMYLGRIGPITMALAFNIKRKVGDKSLPEGKILVG